MGDHSSLDEDKVIYLNSLLKEKAILISIRKED